MINKKDSSQINKQNQLVVIQLKQNLQQTSRKCSYSYSRMIYFFKVMKTMKNVRQRLLQNMQHKLYKFKESKQRNSYNHLKNHLVLLVKEWQMLLVSHQVQHKRHLRYNVDYQLVLLLCPFKKHLQKHLH
ncbi:hypothetical protein B6I74_17230 [Klebsiella variicola]|nr:hypothetical protein B6I74_17230 [Klebsiella variicola]